MQCKPYILPTDTKVKNSLDNFQTPVQKKMAARTSETLVNFYQTTRRCNPEDSHLHTHRLENLKSYPVQNFV
jgi:hypothetical protein